MKVGICETCGHTNSAHSSLIIGRVNEPHPFKPKKEKKRVKKSTYKY